MHVYMHVCMHVYVYACVCIHVGLHQICQDNNKHNRQAYYVSIMLSYWANKLKFILSNRTFIIYSEIASEHFEMHVCVNECSNLR